MPLIPAASGLTPSQVLYSESCGRFIMTADPKKGRLWKGFFGDFPWPESELCRTLLFLLSRIGREALCPGKLHRAERVVETAFRGIHMRRVKGIVLTGYGLNCDYETDYCLRLAGAESHRVHINDLLGHGDAQARISLGEYQILVLGGGFSWGDDHGAGVIMASKLRRHLGQEMERFIEDGNLIIGICNGFQALVNLGLLPGFEGHYHERRRGPDLQ